MKPKTLARLIVAAFCLLLLGAGLAPFAMAYDASAEYVAADKWTGADKRKHFAVSAAAGAAVGAIAPSIEPECGTSCRFWIAMIPGIVKEMDDQLNRGTRWSWKDLAWDAFGAYVGVKVAGLVFTPRSITYRTSF